MGALCHRRRTAHRALDTRHVFCLLMCLQVVGCPGGRVRVDLGAGRGAVGQRARCGGSWHGGGRAAGGGAAGAKDGA